MARLTISIASQGEVVTVSEMRRRLARVLSKLTGQSEITFTFTGNIENYTPAARNTRMPTGLWTPYDLSRAVPSPGGLWKYAADLGSDPMPYCDADERFMD